MPGAVIGPVECRQQLLQVEGMTCSSCSGSVEAALQAVPGVQSAAVNLISGVAEVGPALPSLLCRQPWPCPLPRSAALWSAVGCIRLLAGSCIMTCAIPVLQVQYDPEVAGPRHLVEAVEGAGFVATPLSGQRLGACLPSCLPVALIA